MTSTMSGAKNTKFAKQSARANTIEKRRMEQEIRSIDNSKRAMAVDMRKSQGEYKRRLLNFKGRQKELMMNKSGATMTESSMGEYLLQSLISRQSTSPRRRSQKSAAKSKELKQSHRKQVHNSSESQENHPSRESSPQLPKTPNSGPSDSRPSKSREKVPSPTPTAGTSPYYCAKTPTSRTASPMAPIPETPEPIESGVPRGRTYPSTSQNVRPTTSGAVVKISDQADSDHQAPRRPQTEPALDTDCKGLGLIRMSSDVDQMSVDSDAHPPDEFGAEEELGRISNRQRSKLDLRPDTAWRRRFGSPSPVKNPFHGLSGHLDHPWKQVRYFDQDEIEERGMFYRLLVKDRLEKEKDKVKDIRVRINNFSSLTRTPLNSRPPVPNT